MKFLLIDFGATYIKCIAYDKSTNTTTNPRQYESPFATNNSITSKALRTILSEIVGAYRGIDGVVLCTILGGCWKEGVYYSWKSSTDKGVQCLISGLFNSIVHQDHQPFTTANSYTTTLDVIGELNYIPVYASLGDTNCVIRSLRLKEREVAINMGTGSQIITQTSIQRYFPAGRSFLVYKELFDSLGLDMFHMLNQITIIDVLNSPLDVDLAVFEQARGYISGGSISKIKEGDFTISNLLGALLRAFVMQYTPHIREADKIILVGGISKKISLLPTLFKHYNPSAEIVLSEEGIESTHKGMIEYINEQL